MNSLLKPFFLVTFLMLVVVLLVACGAQEQAGTQVTITPPVVAPSPTPGATIEPTVAAPTPTEEPGAEASVASPTSEPATEPAPTPAPPAAVFPPAITLQPFVSVPNQITYLTHAGDGSDRLFVVEKEGRVSIIEEGRVLETPFLDITDVVDAGASERGLLSIAFDPNYAENGEFYVNYTGHNNGETVIARYRVSEDPYRADAGSARVILTIAQPAANHNGGQIQFGPDGMLFIGTGDGGRAGDPWDNAENLDELLGKMLRIAVSGQDVYAIPADNPFLEQNARAEIWAYGLRNPWRFSFDRDTGDLYIADVGQGAWEEIDVVRAGDPGGQHFGWNTMEGNHCFEPPDNCDTEGKVLPVTEYGHDQGCSVTGGYVYRGERYPSLAGTYFYGDYCSGRIFALRQNESGAWEDALALQSGRNIASFGEDERGELYLLDLKGDIFRLTGS